MVMLPKGISSCTGTIILVGVLREDTLAPTMLIIVIGYILTLDIDDIGHERL